MDLPTYLRVEEKLARTRREADRAQGELDAELRLLKEKFDCASLEEGRKLLVKLQEKERAAQDELTSVYRRFVKRHGDIFGQD